MLVLFVCAEVRAKTTQPVCVRSTTTSKRVVAVSRPALRSIIVGFFRAAVHNEHIIGLHAQAAVASTSAVVDEKKRKTLVRGGHCVHLLLLVTQATTRTLQGRARASYMSTHVIPVD